VAIGVPLRRSVQLPALVISPPMSAMVNVPCASMVQLEDREITGGSVARTFDDLLVTGPIAMEVARGVEVPTAALAGVGVFVGSRVSVVMFADVLFFGRLAAVLVDVSARVGLAALARVLAKISAMSARKPETIKIGLCL
jgi:hypothetical protein